MTENDNETMREFFSRHGYNPEELSHPRNVSPGDINDSSTVVQYGTVFDPSAEHGNSSWQIEEYEIIEIVPADNWSDYTDGAKRYPDETPVTHSVHYAYETANDWPKGVAINYGSEMYGPDSDFEDPLRWDRKVKNVLGLSDDFIRFDL